MWLFLGLVVCERWRGQFMWPAFSRGGLRGLIYCVNYRQGVVRFNICMGGWGNGAMGNMWRRRDCRAVRVMSCVNRCRFSGTGDHIEIDNLGSDMVSSGLGREGFACGYGESFWPRLGLGEGGKSPKMD
ncbi:hypothetical protein Salat_0852800 [Sesamum alatum]|uniref:Glycine-rich protein n=1 Tax=Sesamum alatum TaxID=300844 RepID=A0AAE2CQX4_9LAMI|nr:hypothetical protein Salat_0852800 [Sesamum alatum]